MHSRHFLYCLGLLSTAIVAHAQITFTINATPTADALGYVTTQNYNFAFTLNTDPTTGQGPFQPGTATADNNYTWLQEWTFDPQIWTNITGDELTGSWTEPSSVTPDPFSKVIASVGDPTLTLYGGADVSNVGLIAGGSPVQFISFSGSFTGLTFGAITDTLPDPNSYFAGYTGDYPASSTTTGWIHDTGGGGDAFFVINSLSVSVSTIPEPAAYAVIAGAVGLGFAVWKRRCRQTAFATA